MIGLIVAVALPAGASAAGRPLLPQGNSGANQYVESIPTVGGQRPTSSVDRRRSASSRESQVLTPSVQSALARQGHAGRETTALAATYAPANRRRSRRGAVVAGGGSSSPGTPAGGTPAGGTPAQSGSSASAMLVRSLTGFSSPGLGAGLSVILILSALGAGVLRVVRRRRVG